MVFEIKHPLIDVKLSIMRDEKTKSKEFRESLYEIASLMSYEIFKDIGTHASEDTFMTPTGVELQKIKLDNKIILVPILRAGVGMVDGIRNMIPTARIGHIGIYRDEKTLEPHEYYFKLPKVDNPLVVLVDPMLATGGTAIASIDAIKARGYNNIRMATLVASPLGIERVSIAHPDVHIYVAAIDEKLNEHGYIIPGLGDAGDRIFGTR